MSNVTLFILSAFLTWFLVLIIIPYLRIGFLDIPNIRSSHSQPIARAGGIAFVLVGTVMNFTFSSGEIRWIPILCLPLAVIGLIDDFKDLLPFTRYAFQLGTALALVAFSNLSFPPFIIIFLIIFITAIINFINFMDGLDGLVAGSAVLLFASTSNWAISGAIFGFLIWNWSPAKIFMGDVGSTFIGSVLSGLMLQSDSHRHFMTLLLISFPLLADAFFCIIRRTCNRENIFMAHRKHLFQRLNLAGWSHARVATLYISAVGILFIAHEMGKPRLLLFVIIAEFFLGLYLDNKVAKKFAEV